MKTRDEEGRGGERDSRNMEDRALESRAMTDERLFDEDPFLGEDQDSGRLLRGVDLGPDWVPVWKRWTISGQVDGRNITMTDASKHGYVPVHPDEVPHYSWLVSRENEGVGSLAGASIRVNDLMLFKKPRHIEEAYMRKLQRDADNSIAALRKRPDVKDSSGSNISLNPELTFSSSL